MICGPGLVARPRWEAGLQGANCETGHRSVSFGFIAKRGRIHRREIDRGGLAVLGWEKFGFNCCARNQIVDAMSDARSVFVCQAVN